MVKWVLFIVLSVVALSVTACGSDDSGPRRVRRPTAIPATPTPRSTPLPDVAMPPALGTSDRPVSLQIVTGDASNTRARAMQDDLEAYFANQGVTVEVELLASEAEALHALCQGRGDASPAAVWASAFTLAAAEQTCDAHPALAVVRGRGTRAAIGDTTEIIAHNGISTLSDLAGRTFCRLEADDLISWVLPALLLRDAGIDPLTSLGAIRNYPDNPSMVRAVFDGDCDAAALPPGEFDNALDALADDLAIEGDDVTRSDLDEQILVVYPAGDFEPPDNVSTWIGYDAGVIPYDVLVFPPNHLISAGLRQQMTDILIEYAGSTSGQRLLAELLDATDVLDVRDTSSTSRDYFAAFRSLADQSNWGMARSD